MIQITIKKDNSFCDEKITFSTTGKLIVNPFGIYLKLKLDSNREELDFFDSLVKLEYLQEFDVDNNDFYYILGKGIILIVG